MATDVKICGLTRAIDAEFADAAGAAYLGVIFAGGPRQRLPAEARATLAGRRARKVGVFAAQSPAEIADIASTVGLDVVQLHAEGDAARVDAVRAATGREVWAVVRTADGVLPDGVDELADAADALLVDTLVKGALGGSGTVMPWGILGESLDAMESGHRIVLAGGLTPDNVAEAISYVSPMIVDVSSGVESAPGVKDHARIRAFVAAVRATSDASE
ncbi:MAG: phosphoribosylanthranilate isomerase [Gemmatimonadaceae bacterium]|nr:phosphoribosylanthranilate isomerase [Gemmatimonadaceae bacterium]NUS32681.1 phosphoribosylanthranilate isomerase [Gemmatimonadaceae bacterium]